MSPKPEPLDSADLDAVVEMQKSLGYSLYAERLGEEIERKRAQLEQYCDPEITASLRGAIAALRTALNIPGILIEEAQSQCQLRLNTRR